MIRVSQHRFERPTAEIPPPVRFCAELVRGERVDWLRVSGRRLAEFEAMRSAAAWLIVGLFLAALFAFIVLAASWGAAQIAGVKLSTSVIGCAGAGLAFSIAWLGTCRLFELGEDFGNGGISIPLSILGGSILLGSHFPSHEVLSLCVSSVVPFVSKFGWATFRRGLNSILDNLPDGELRASWRQRIETDERLAEQLAEKLPWLIRWLVIASADERGPVRIRTYVVDFLVSCGVISNFVVSLFDALSERLSGAPPPAQRISKNHAIRCERNLAQPWAGGRIFYTLLPRGVHASAV